MTANPAAAALTPERLAELRALAEAALKCGVAGPPWYRRTVDVYDHSGEVVEFLRAVSPTTVIALLDALSPQRMEPAMSTTVTFDLPDEEYALLQDEVTNGGPESASDDYKGEPEPPVVTVSDLVRRLVRWHIGREVESAYATAHPDTSGDVEGGYG